MILCSQIKDGLRNLQINKKIIRFLEEIFNFRGLYSFLFCNRVLVVKTKRHDTAKISLKQKHTLKSPDQIYNFILSNSKKIFYLSLKI